MAGNNVNMYSAGVLDGVGVEGVKFVKDHFRIIIRYSVLLGFIETLIWVPTPPSLDLIMSIISIFLCTMFAITLHRKILTDDHQIPPTIDLRVLFFVVVAFCQTIVIVLVAFVVLVLGFGSIQTGILLSQGLPDFISSAATLIFIAAWVLGLAVGLLWILSRTILFFPHIAVTPKEKISLGGVWLLSDGLVWEIAKRLAVYTVVAGAITVLTLVLSPVEEIDTVSRRLVTGPAYFIESVVFYLTSACFVALASLIYKRATNDLHQQQSGDGTLAPT